MGLSPFSRCSCGNETVRVVEKLPNPNPKNFTIVRSEQHSDWLILEVLYPDCTNYEGRKILLMPEGVTLQDVVRQGTLDPHFCDSATHISPVARFEPTELGWKMAQELTFQF